MSNPLNVLVVDDSLSMRTIASKIVESLGHNVVAQAENGKVALKQFMEHRPDIVLLDLVMPIFDGKKTLKKLIQVDPNVKVVVCSSLGSEGDIEFCLKEGAMFYLQKPYEEQGFKTAFDNITASMTPTV
jgi:two-component system chemotaxis response regulator CheY